jgi:hypothetical protein
MKARLATLAVVVALLGTFAVSATRTEAQPNQQGSRNVVAGLLNLFVLDQVNVTDNVVQVGLVNVNRSLNNLRALNNVLNNNNILRDISVLRNIRVGDINVVRNSLNNNQITALNNFLNNNNIQIGQVVGISVLSGGDIIIFR